MSFIKKGVERMRRGSVSGSSSSRMYDERDVPESPRGSKAANMLGASVRDVSTAARAEATRKASELIVRLHFLNIKDGVYKGMTIAPRTSSAELVIALLSKLRDTGVEVPVGVYELEGQNADRKLKHHFVSESLPFRMWSVTRCDMVVVPSPSGVGVRVLEDGELRYVGEDRGDGDDLRASGGQLHGEKADSAVDGADRSTMIERRRRLFQELIDTEQTYNSALRFLHEQWMLPLSNKAGTKDEIITDNEVKMIFGGIDAILAVSSQLVVDLSSRFAQWSADTCFGDVLCDLSPYLALYKTYFGQFERGDEEVKKKLKTNKNFLAMWEKNKAHPDAARKDVTDMLIMPIQRLPRYVMLLKEILKKTPDDHDDCSKLKTALSLISVVTKEADEAASNPEAQARRTLAVIQSLGDECKGLYETHRVFVLETTMMKRWTTPTRDGNSSKVKIYIFNDIIVVFENNKYNCMLSLHLAWIKVCKWEEKLFEILTINRKRCFFLEAESSLEREKIVQALESGIHADVFNSSQEQQREQVVPVRDVYINQVHWDSSWCLPEDPHDAELLRTMKKGGADALSPRLEKLALSSSPSTRSIKQLRNLEEQHAEQTALLTPRTLADGLEKPSTPTSPRASMAGLCMRCKKEDIVAVAKLGNGQNVGLCRTCVNDVMAAKKKLTPRQQ